MLWINAPGPEDIFLLKANYGEDLYPGRALALNQRLLELPGKNLLLAFIPVSTFYCDTVNLKGSLMLPLNKKERFFSAESREQY